MLLLDDEKSSKTFKVPKPDDRAYTLPREGLIGDG
jgi:hypothetical protein